MTAAPPGPNTVLTLLFGPAEQVPDALSRAIANAGTTGNMDSALRNLPQATREAAAREVTAATAELLDVGLIDLLVAGWRTCQDLTSAARRTLATPGSTELVPLVTHQVSISQEPYVAVLVDGRQVATVRLGLSAVFDISAVQARIRAGCLAGIHSGGCEITATLAIDGIDVASRKAHLDLPGEIALAGELRLLPAADYQAGGSKATAPVNTGQWWQPAAQAPQSWWQGRGQP